MKEISNFANKSLAACNLDLRTYVKDMCGREKKTRWDFNAGDANVRLKSLNGAIRLRILKTKSVNTSG